MGVREKLHIGMSLAPTWLGGDAWRRPDSEIEQVYSSGFALDIAKRSEAAKLDFVFRPDSLFLNVGALESGPGFGSLDPTILLAAIARETSHIGLLTTVSTTFFPPYVVARQLQSLNWISGGRAGWNIVTALDGNENFGLSEMPSAKERYERAAEFTEIVRRLWDSYPAEALELDRASGRYTNASMVRPIDHEGRHLKVKGPLNLPAYGEDRIPLVQAGASPEGRDFAASVADAIFASTPDREAAAELRQDLRRRAEGHGRRAEDIRLMPGLSLYLAESREEAVELFNATHARMDVARKFASILEMTGLDLRDWPQQQRITTSDLPPVPEKLRSRTHAELLRRLIRRDEPTVADLLTRPEVIGSAHWQIVGTVDDAVAEIMDWQSAGAIDGFIAVPGGSVASMRLVLDEVVPRLAEAGRFRTDYSGRTFLGHLQA
ncbi:NtaA/DmoA family FMN-dependent monooxygenase [Nisaea acidiphila]|uniref:NtaA/DmoA family FMN-dependent monooxygenase n=1 Tax=Nisaea acidiphila TaxID=1862145 RepID=A0A9J7AQX2_9PROT|nr:NtaA/DmoA family FMN-dependent monooxygenase [Nisaea acidiphila]UUX49282.1 NtaA/DmoA family FMN-dependent monooxygenase [Nisaea acidiphila]